ncbi:MAG: hypothetical protein FWD48_03700 [Oscillospiraceae bacterium]|nr:hypothetical protein [Oscillospiraceae bacterium]
MYSEKQASPTAFLFLFLGTAITGSVLSFIYLWINQVNPIVYLSILAAVALGAAMGFVSTKIIKLFKIKSVVPALAVVILACLLFSYFKWALYVAQDANRGFRSMDDEDLFYTWISYEYYVNDFTDENGVPYSDMEAVITEMMNTSAYDYGILENEFIWWAWDTDPATLSRRDIRDLQNMSYYEAIAWDYTLGNFARTAALLVEEFFNSSEYAYMKYYAENDGAFPTAVYYMANPAALIDTIIRINGEGRWTYSSDTNSNAQPQLFNGILLWLVWLVEFFVICGYAVFAIPKAMKDPPPAEEGSQVQYYDNNTNYEANPTPAPASVDNGDNGWGSGGFGAAAEAPQAEQEQYDEQGRPIAQADEYGR